MRGWYVGGVFWGEFRGMKNLPLAKWIPFPCFLLLHFCTSKKLTRRNASHLCGKEEKRNNKTKNLLPDAPPSDALGAFKDTLRQIEIRSCKYAFHPPAACASVKFRI